MTTFTTTTLLIALAAGLFLILGRVRPGRELPNAPGWYARALIITMFQLGITGYQQTLEASVRKHIFIRPRRAAHANSRVVTEFLFG